MRRLILGSALLILGLAVPATAQQAGENINVLPVVLPDGGDTWYLEGDGYLQRQVEPTIAASTRNPDHLLAFFNDYRAVDVAEGDVGLGEETQTVTLAAKVFDLLLAGLLPKLGLPEIEAPPMAAAEAWVGGSRSYDGGLTWSGFFMPGAPENFYPPDVDPSFDTTQLPIFGLEAATDPVAAAGPCGYVYVSFVAFTRGGQSKMVVARFQDRNDEEGGDTWEYQTMTVLETGNNAEFGYFLDKPHIAVDIWRGSGAVDQCDHRVYNSYSTFNGLTKDGKIQTKVNFGISTDRGETFTTQKINKNWGQNQGSFIAVDPRPTLDGGGTVYVFWRHFFDPDTIIMTRTTDYGVKWTAPVSILGDTPMAPFDQPTISSTVPGTNPVTDLTFRSNGFPTAAVTGDGTVFAAWQERVDIDPDSDTFGEPKPFDPQHLLPTSPEPASSPRIVLTRSDDGGGNWTGPWDPDTGDHWPSRRAVDFGDRDSDPGSTPPPGFGALPQERAAGPQVMPWLSFGGGRLALAYYESRGLYTPSAIDPETWDPVEAIQPEDVSLSTGFISGIERVVDFRAALLDPSSGQLLGTSQVSRYPISSYADLATEDVGDVAPVYTGLPTNDPEVPVTSPCSPDFGEGYPPCKRSLNFMNKPQSGSGTSPFMGDYPGLAPIVQFVCDYDAIDGECDWRWATEPEDVPYRAFHAVFADNRHLVPPTEAPQDANESNFSEWNLYKYYQAPESGVTPCINPGSRNTDVLISRVDAELVVSAPTTYKMLSERRGFPITVANRSAETRWYRLEITEGIEFASFAVDPDLLDPDVDPWMGVVEIFAYSSVSQMVYITPPEDEETDIGQIRIAILQVDADGDLLQDGEQGVVTLIPDPTNTGGGGADAQNPFVLNEGVSNPFVLNPFVLNPFVLNPFVLNPFVLNPFVLNPFVLNTAIGDEEVYDVIDTTWSITQSADSTASSFLSLINIDNAEQFLGNYAFQLLIYKASSHGTFDGCQPTIVDQTQILSNVSQDPDDTTYNPFVLNPFVLNPFVLNPFVLNPFVLNSTVTVGPSDLPENTSKSYVVAEDGTLRAPLPPDKVYVTLRAFQLVPNAELGDFVYQPEVDEPAFSTVALPCTDPDCILSLAPDLIAGKYSFILNLGVPVSDPPTITAGVPFTVDWDLVNVGTIEAEAENRDLRHGLYLSANKTVQLGPDDKPTDGDLLVGWAPSAADTLASCEHPDSPDGTCTESFSDVPVVVPFDADPAKYQYLVLFVDDYREISESDELNNQSWVEIVIEAPPADKFFEGFFNPWTETPTYTVNAGSAIPLKWLYRDPETDQVVDSGDWAPAIYAKRFESGLTCPPLDPSSPGTTNIITALPNDPGSSDLRYSPSSGTWQFNWETDPAAPGCYALRVLNQVTGLTDPLYVKLK
jgi:hypothetical protein